MTKNIYDNFIFKDVKSCVKGPNVNRAIQHAPAKLPSKLHMIVYVDFLAQSLCSVHSDCASKLG